MRFRNLICLAALIAATGISVGQALSDDAPAQQPILVVRYAGFDSAAGKDYFEKLRADLSIGNTLFQQIADQKESQEAATSTLEKPVSGMLLYLTPGMIPSPESVQFSQVADHAEFIRIVHARAKLNGDTAKLEGSGDLYSIVMTNTWRAKVDDAIQPVSSTEVLNETAEESGAADDTEDNPIPAGAQGSVTFSLGAATGTGVTFQSSVSQGDGTLIEVNGEKFREYSATSTNHFRYYDGFLFEGQAESLKTMTLPPGASLQQLENNDVTGEMVFHPDRIPMGLRMLGWNALSTAAGAELQQRDDEAEADYELRRSAGDAGLALIRSFMFDVDKVAATVKVSLNENPVEGEFRIGSRKNSDLGRTLRDFASAERRMAPILNDNSAVTVYLAAHLPEEWRKVVQAFANLVIDEESRPASNARVLKSSSNILNAASSLQSIADHGNLEFCIKFGWTPESGVVVYGGLQLNDNPELLTWIVDHLTESENATCELVELHGHQMLKSSAPDEQKNDSLISHLYVANIDSCLWFAGGGENAYEIIHQSVTRCREAGGRIATPIFTASVDLGRWAEYPQDEGSGLTAMHTEWYAWTTEMFGFLVQEYFFGESMETSEGDDDKNELFQKALALGGSKAMSFTIDADESGLVAHSSIGAAVVRGYVAVATLSLEDLVLQSKEIVNPAEASSEK